MRGGIGLVFVERLVLEQRCREGVELVAIALQKRDNFRVRRIPADAIWLDIHYQDKYKPFTWDSRRFPDPARMIGDLRKDGFRIVTIVDPHPKKEPGYAPYDSGLAGDHFVKNADGSIYEAPVWPSRAEDGDAPDWSKPSGTPSVFPISASRRRGRGGAACTPLWSTPASPGSGTT